MDLFLVNNLIWMLPLICVFAFLIIALFSQYIPTQGAIVSIGSIGIAFLIFIFVLIDFVNGGLLPIHSSFTWIDLGEWQISWGLLIDRISIVMIGLITFVAFLVQIYSVGYMKGDSRFGWYFAVHSLFAAAMLLLVLSDNLLLLYFAWELVGLGSYLLIGFWYEKKSAAEAAKKAFVTTRIGDVGLLIGIIILFKASGTFDISSIIHVAQEGGISNDVIFWSSLLIFLGAMGKSAQFPLHVWLPDAMEGPTPVSALIHAATMVAAGIYLVGRMFPLFELGPGILTIISIVGIVTFILAGAIALVMTDIKRVLAYSTISHLGLMMLSLGSFGAPAAFFHLVIHGFSKALLFLGAGSVMHGMHDQTEVELMGGLRKKMPITSITFLIGTLSLAGIVPLSGFFSKDEILISIWEYNPWFFPVTLFGVFLSSLYMIRLYCLIFLSSARSDYSEKAHESPRIMTYPLIILSVLAVFSGLLAFPSPITEWQGFAAFIDDHHKFHMVPWITAVSIVVAFSGAFLGWVIYGARKIEITAISKPFKFIYQLVSRKFLFDEIYSWIATKIVFTFARWLTVFDRVIVNDTGIDGVGNSTKKSADRLKYFQSGYLYNYSLVMVIGLFLMAIIWWVIE
ncbi:MAG: NADH-quinone oxidoreductase subunit L [SAR202 cluster bacterium]|nr:NADH-quinone oxidoreductase subunit L [SAR202 cluster bacterium]